MQKNEQRQLALFTLKYPYGNSEPFIENEIEVLAKSFSKVFVFPSESDSNKRPVPQNVYVQNDLCRIRSGKRHILRVLIKHPFKVIKCFLVELLGSDSQSYITYWKSMLDYLCQDLDKYSRLKRWVSKKSNHNMIFYDYWFLNSAVSLAYLRKQNHINKLVTRAHGFDLYDDRHLEGAIPFRSFKIKWIDRVYCISKHGQEYLKSKIDSEYHFKVLLSYMGVKTGTVKAENSDDDKITIVTCGRVIDFKNIHKMPEILKKVACKVKWIHFGDGPLLQEVKLIIPALNSNIETTLYGDVPNATILDFYRNNQVDLFMSLSKSEGLPISMMEAQMYGIPILALCVNGVPEIVSEETGFCIDPKIELSDLAENFAGYLESLHRFDRDAISKRAKELFDRESNYRSFCENLKW
ncbi:glycosyltransferase [Ekhidna sp.]|uniref:glycosyltransferase n=1 Tax=Ekhidna sp. TaxID=2608089 RepID=UPI003C7A8807